MFFFTFISFQSFLFPSLSLSCVCVMCAVVSSQWVDFVSHVRVWTYILVYYYYNSLTSNFFFTLPYCMNAKVHIYVYAAYNKRQLWKVINRFLFLSHSHTLSSFSLCKFMFEAYKRYFSYFSNFSYFHIYCAAYPFCRLISFNLCMLVVLVHSFCLNRTLWCSLDALELCWCCCLRRPLVSVRFVYSDIFFWESVVCRPNSLIRGINFTKCMCM